jgi:hypothetical protein
VANAIERYTFQQVDSIRNTTVDGYSMSLVVNRTTKLRSPRRQQPLRLATLRNLTVTPT